MKKAAFEWFGGILTFLSVIGIPVAKATRIYPVSRRKLDECRGLCSMEISTLKQRLEMGDKSFAQRDEQHKSLVSKTDKIITLLEVMAKQDQIDEAKQIKENKDFFDK